MVGRNRATLDEEYEDDYNEFDGEELDEELEEEMPEAGWAAALQESFGSLPWWILSTIIHMLIVALMAIFVVTADEPKPSNVIIPVDMVEQAPIVEQEKIHEEFKSDRTVPLPNQVEHPVVVHEEPEEFDHMETENNMDNNTARGEEDAISDIPCGGKGVVGSLGIGGGGGGAFGFRGGGGRKRAALQGGGSMRSEDTVDGALEWLYIHQESDGHWEGERVFEEGDSGSNSDPAVTGLALLAFLGAGHSESAGNKKYIKTVQRGVRWLIKHQKPNGSIGHGFFGHLGYNHAIAGLALAESAAMGGSPHTKRAAQKAVDYALNIHISPAGGWRYNATNPGDVSVTGWFVMLLKSAKIGGLKVDGRGFQSAAILLEKCSKGNGTTAYMPGEDGTITTTAIGILCRQFMGWNKADPLLQAGAQHLMGDLPTWNDINYYYWYYGTLVMFQMGGNHWKAWNASMRDMLVENQRKGEKNVNGSWDPIGSRSDAGGRVYSTAMACLCLEVYYRYSPLYR